MSATKPEQPPAEPIRLTANAIVAGQFIRAGDPTPYTAEENLPESLKPFVATGDEEPFRAVERNIYDVHPALRGQARRLEAIALEKERAESLAAEPPAPNLAAAITDAHELHIGAALKQAEVDQRLRDSAFEAMQPPAPPQLFVRRGGEMARIERAKLKVGETVFVRRESGQMESVGVINQNGEPPEPEIQL
jgi:hypothetical protein